MIKATIDNSYKTEFEHSPVFFMRVESREVQNSSDWRDTSLEYYWNSAIPHIHCVMDDKKIATDKGLKLMIADYPFISSEVKSETSDSSQTINARLSYQVHPFSRTSYYDIWFLICCMLNRKQNGKDNFYFQELLWVLDNYWLDEITLTPVLSNYNAFYLTKSIAVFRYLGT